MRDKILSCYFMTFLSSAGVMSSNNHILKIPNDFLLGFASSAYQIEGGWDLDGKGESIWDRLIHTEPSMVKDRSSGDVSSDSYHRYKEDVALIKEMRGQVYRFSLSWPRILPNGLANDVNEKGLNYYNKLIDELIANDIEPVVTLYHWDLPQALQDIGGWTNEHLIEYFQDYARIAFSTFGDRVKKWITFNEPLEVALFGYGMGFFAPMVKKPGLGEYLAGHTILKAHARAYHIYQDEFKSLQQGVLGISLSTSWFVPKTSDPKDIQAANTHIQFSLGWFAHPIFSEHGDYPEEMKRAIAENSKTDKYPRSRLPEFDDYWISYIKGTSDFFGLNHYTTNLISFKDRSKEPTSWQTDSGTETSVHPDWPKTASTWFRVVPEGFRQALVYIKKEYRNPLIYVTENGVSDKGALDDHSRVSYFQDYIGEMLRAIHIDGVNVKMYTAWSLVDSFEWLAGYTERFGVVKVDFEDPMRKRTIKKSGKYLREIYKNRQIPDRSSATNLPNEDL